MNEQPGANGGSDPIARIERSWEILGDLHRYRGQYLSGMAELESILDETIAVYFGHPMSEAFGRLTACVNMGDKLSITDMIVNELRLQNEFPDFVKRARKANERRNAIAHSHVQTDWGVPRVDRHRPLTPEQRKRLNDWRYWRSTRSGTAVEPADRYRLLDDCKEALDLIALAMDLLDSVEARSDAPGV